MDLRSRVVFCLGTEVVTENYSPYGHTFGTHEYYLPSVNNLDEFCSLIKNFIDMVRFGRMSVNKATYCIKINRNVIVSDEDDRVHFPSITFPDKEQSVILSATDKLLYMSDIEPLLRQKQPGFCVKEDKDVGNRPVYLESFDGYDAKYRPLTQGGAINDIVIDTNLNQLWPVATGRPPVGLLNLLSKTTEKVR